MPDLSVNLSLPYIQPAQAQKHVTHNEALQILDAVVQLAVLSHDLAVPPADPTPGARYVVAQGAEGAWAGRDDALALYQGGAWMFFAPQPGWRAFVADIAADIVWHDGAWRLSSLDNLPGVGINAAADAANRLAVSADATLLSHEGAGHRLKINKAGTNDTASLLFQTGFSGRAEMGCAGSDDFTVKVSPGGDTWFTALQIGADTGVLDLAAGATIGGQGAYHAGNLLGPVSEQDGMPTGAVIERGSTANGTYVRFADGTQICTADVNVDIDTPVGALFFSGVVTQDFPMPFVEKPVGSGAMANTINGWVNGRAGNATQWTCAAYSHAARTGDTMQLVAVGRWF
ncbi:DUF2793 domain-containing protein [Roseovarius atlanticus]|uniref:DUF2793 domain-containing protein n=1 Tax=Roseovarius atlanticus TaxID=1641875 RepID=UPI001C98984F|nr:DUF2793 domain-containing protein [Roseovarius atlanticus]MBY6127070.1 DUF2793 domain-containing protein [Roseovarius atlanticus]MBY6151564.1 DUF2793 domain-containing protein [Roseovarius atlanticus]